jgi:hypothetical protein
LSNEPIIDLEACRLPADIEETVLDRPLVSCKVGRPNRQHFVRVRTEPEFQVDVACYVDSEDRDYYLVDNAVRLVLQEEVKLVTLYVAITRDRGLFIWPVPRPNADGKINPWIASQREAAERAKENWVRLASNRKLGMYEVVVAPASIGKPEWPPYSFQEIIEVAFRNRYIRDLDHPVIQGLLGNV